MNMILKRLFLTGTLASFCAIHAAKARAEAATDSTAVKPDQTELHIDSNGVVHAPPDLLTISLFAQKTANTPVSAQLGVNNLVKQATQRAASFKHVDLSIASYDVSREGDKTVSWTARQTLQIQAADAASVLDLAGQLQTIGLAIGSMQWSLSDENRDKLTKDAEVKALTGLRTRAAMAAQAMGMTVASFKSIRLGDRRIPMPRMMMASMAPSPQSTPEEQEISATASATVMLSPTAK